MRTVALMRPRVPTPMRFDSFDATVRDDGWYEVSADENGEWIATECPVEVRP